MDQAKDGGQICKDNDEIYVPNWLVEVLAWIKRVEMANSALSTASQTFYTLCLPKLHGNLKRYLIDPHFLNEHQFNVHTMGIAMLASTSTSTRMKAVPIFNSSMPDCDYLLDLIDFREIELRYLDGQILAIIERIVQRCGTIELNFSYDPRQQMLSPKVAVPIQRLRRTVINTANQSIRRLMNVLMKNNKTIRLGFTSDRNLDQMEVFKKLFCSDTDNNAVELPEQKVFRLAKSHESEKFIEYLKNDFSNSTEPFNLFIHLDEKYAEFTLENNHTGETLQLYHKHDMWGRFLYNYLVRHPNGQGAHWKREGQKKIMQSWMKAQMANICMNVVKIGNF